VLGRRQHLPTQFSPCGLPNLDRQRRLSSRSSRRSAALVLRSLVLDHRCRPVCWRRVRVRAGRHHRLRLPRRLHERLEAGRAGKCGGELPLPGRQSGWHAVNMCCSSGFRRRQLPADLPRTTVLRPRTRQRTAGSSPRVQSGDLWSGISAAGGLPGGQHDSGFQLVQPRHFFQFQHYALLGHQQRELCFLNHLSKLHDFNLLLERLLPCPDVIQLAQLHDPKYPLLPKQDSHC
jgi:hypothetical protein